MIEITRVEPVHPFEYIFPCFTVNTISRAPTDIQDYLVKRGILAKMGNQVALDERVCQVQRVVWESVAIVENREIRDTRELMDTEGHSVRKVKRVKMEMTAQWDSWESR